PEIGGTVTGAGIYDYGFTAELKATPANGYNFINWTENGTEVSANTVYSFPVQSSKIFTANFEIINSIVINANSNAIQIFPNPTTGLVNVKLSDKTNDLHSKIRVFLTNSLGVKTNLSCIYKSDNLIEIDISEFANGMYIVEFYFDYRIIGSSKVLKK
ncbi:MAG: T9SS type A sorting domain-containing protein, partial [Bacilli bacterium]